MKNNKRAMIVSSIVILSTMVIGLVLYPRLPDQIATHFQMDGTPDGYSSKAYTVFGLPIFLMIINLFVWFGLSTDPKKKNISPKMKELVIWIMPIISVVVMTMTYANALQLPVNVSLICSLMISILFLAIGNYLPKCKQTYTVGIRLPWTLNDEDNWNKTHRLGGFVWTLGGLITLINTFVGAQWVMIAVVVAIILIPSVYSFLLYQKKAH